MEAGSDAGGGGTGPVRSPQDLAGGALLIALCIFVLIMTRHLAVGGLGQLGPGMAPTAAALGLGGFGLFFVVSSFLWDGPRLEAWHLRGPLCVLGAILFFAATIRSIGLIFAGPITLILASFADRSTRLVEVVIFAVVMTAFCIFVFSYLLGLPIPVLPLWLSQFFRGLTASPAA